MSEIPNNLPLPLSSFIGRAREVAELRRLLTTSRLVTLTGAGGCGKTRLALEVATQLSEDYADGVWFVDLAPLSDPALIAPRLASTLNVHEQPGQSLLTSLLNSLQRQHGLLLLDNCEHVIEACAHLVQALLQACPHLTILATGREALRVSGELTFRVPPLSVPPSHTSAAELTQYVSVQMFVARARAAHSTFALNDRSSSTVVQICQRLDGMPLALALAATLVNALSLEQIASRLNDVFQLLPPGSRAAMPRQQSLQATMDWSHQLLPEVERTLFRRLSVFASGWSAAAAEYIGSSADIRAADVMTSLIQLVHKSLVYTEERDSETRYRMLEPIRQYAHERLLALQEVAAVQDRHLDFFVRMAEEAAPLLVRNTLFAWLNRLSLEHDNLRAALQWSCSSPERSESGLRMARALGAFWSARDHHREGLTWLEPLLARTGGEPTSLRAYALVEAGRLGMQIGELASSRALAEEGLKIFRNFNDPSGTDTGLFILGRIAFHQGEYASARLLLEESLAFGRAISDQVSVVWRLFWLGSVAFGDHDYALARARYEESRVLCKQGGNKWCLAAVSNGLGDLALRAHDYATAEAMYDESLLLSRQLDSPWNVARVLNLQGHALLRQGRPAEAANLHGESLCFFNTIGHTEGVCHALEMLAALAVEQRQLERAAQLFGARESLCAAQVDSAVTRQDREAIGPEHYEDAVAAARVMLGEAAFAKAWATGETLTMEQAIGEALQVTVSEPPIRTLTAPAAAYPAELTAREIEVLRWLVRGLSDNEIAKQLVISPHTVHGHLRSIYGKLDVTSRAAAIHVAHEMKLV